MGGKKRAWININIGQMVPLNVEKLVLGTILAGGFIVIAILSLVLGIETGVATIIATVLATLGSLLGIIVASAWPKGDSADKETIKSLAEKVPPPTVPVEDIQGTVKDDSKQG